MIKYLKYSPILFMFILFAVSIAGCGGAAEKSSRVAKLDSMQKALTSLESRLKDIDREDVKDNYVTVKDNLQKIYVVFQNNPLSIEEESLIQYEKLKVDLNRLLLDIDNIEKEIQFGIQQTNIWKTSINKGDARIDEFLQYCQSESAAIHSLALILTNKSKEWSNMQEQIKKYDSEFKKLISKK